MATPAVAGTAPAQTAPAQSVYGLPKYGTQKRLVPDSGNQSVALVPAQGLQTNAPTTKLDQLDIVRGLKIYANLTETWTAGAAKTLTKSPFYPATCFSLINIKLQAAYSTFNLTGALASIIQAFRPQWGAAQVGQTRPNVFANPVNAVAPTISTAGTPTVLAPMSIDVPFSWFFHEYYDLDAQGNPMSKHFDTVVTPVFMAAQARVVNPTIQLGPQLGSSDLLGSPVAGVTGDTLSTLTAATGSLQFMRDAWWTSSNPAANPPSFPWMYTRDMFQQPTQGQAKVGVLIQNTNVSVGQVLSLFGFVWDPAANAGLGGIVPMSSIFSFELVTGGSLQNRYMVPQVLTDKMRALYGAAIVDNFPNGVFVIDFMLEEDGGYFSNANAINTYLVNGVALNITFVAGSIPSATATVYLGVEALKLVTS